MLLNPNQEGGFENGLSFGANGWTAVNATINSWRVSGVAVPFAGTRSAFISGDGGGSYSYATNFSQTSHFYRDISVPSGENLIQLSFNYKNLSGDPGFDRLLVYIAPTFVIPVSNDPISDDTELEDATLVYEGSNYTNYTEVNLTLPSSLEGTTFRLIFTWQNDASDGSGIPVSIDNIGVVSQVSNFGGPLSGLYTINNQIPTSPQLPASGSNFNNFSDAIEYLNQYGLSATVRFHVAQSQQFNHQPLTLTQSGNIQDSIFFIGMGSDKPVIFFSGGLSASDAGITLSGVSYINFHNLKFQANPAPINSNDNIEFLLRVLNSSASIGSQHNVVYNCDFVHNQLFSSNISLLQNTPVNPTSASGTNSFNSYLNSTFNNTVNAMRIQSNANFRDDQILISECLVGNSGPNSLGITQSNAPSYAIYVLNTINTKVTNCRIENITTNGIVDGIWFTGVAGTAEISANIIRNIRNSLASNLTGNVVNGIRCILSSNAEARIFNNFVSDLQTASTQSTGAIMVRGISIQPTGVVSNSDFFVDFNSVSIDGSSNPNVSYACLEVIQPGARVTMRNNILANFTSGQSGSNKHFGIQAPNINLAASGSFSDFNDLYIHQALNGAVARIGTTEYSSLNSWQAATIFDDNSLEIDPEFIDKDSDLHTVSELLAGAGSLNGISWITTDIDGELRENPPFIGADEIIDQIIDLAFIEYLSPDSIGCFTDNEQILIKIRNKGNQAVDFETTPLNISVDVSGPVNQVFNLTISDNQVNSGQPLAALSFLEIPIGSLDMTLAGNYQFFGIITIADDVNLLDNELNFELLNRPPFILPEMVSFSGYDGSNLEIQFENWYEALTGTVGPVYGNADWNISQGLGNINNIAASFNYNVGLQDSWIISQKFTPEFNTFLSFDLALTEAFSNAGLGEFDQDDVFQIWISDDCGISYSLFQEFNEGNIIPSSLTNFEFSLAQFSGQQIQLAFFASDGQNNQVPFNLHLDNIQIFNSSLKKIQFVNFINPIQKVCYEEEELISVKIKNTGFAAIDFADNPVDLNVVIDLDGVQNQLYSKNVDQGLLAINQEIEVEIELSASFLPQGKYTLIASLMIEDDGIIVVDSIETIVYGQNPAVTLFSIGEFCYGAELEVSAQVSITGINESQFLQFSYAGLPVAIPDGNPNGVDIPIEVSGAANPAGRVFSVKIDSLVHSNLTQLSIALIAPDGSEVLLTEFNSGNAPGFFNTEFSMNANQSISGSAPPFSGLYIPAEPFSNLSGLSDGTWFLRVIDFTPGFVGVLHNWSMVFHESNSISSHSWTTQNTVLSDSFDNLLMQKISLLPVQYQLTDINGCAVNEVWNSPITDFLAVNSTNTDINCEGCSALVTLSATGGQAPYQGTGVFEVFEPGEYEYQVVDANGCDTLIVVTVLSTVGLDIIAKEDLLVFPNPFNEHLNIRITNPHQSMDVVLMDAAGRVVSCEVTDNPDGLTISTTSLSKGVYYLNVRIDNLHSSYKVVKI